MKNQNFPVLIIAYARDEQVKKIVHTCIENEVDTIYVAIDGARDETLRIKQDNLVRHLKEFANLNQISINFLRHSANLGVGVGVISALDWFFSNEKSGHILEDDLLVDASFFNFSRDALGRFEKNQVVKMISGTQMFPASSSLCQSTNYPMIWGWSTWADDWFEMRSELLNKRKYRFVSPGSSTHNYWAVGANRVLDGKVDTWDTPLAAAFLFLNWTCITPPVNLVSNIGDDLNASHTKSNTLGLNMPIQELLGVLDFETSMNTVHIQRYNKLLEKKIFRIKLRHTILPLYSFLFDRYKYRKTLSPLVKRLQIK